ncbi:hypothetical protein [Leptolyngbya sp. AN10]|uniref:hypothetical protein n=1 Tax=Leptolyngbya sp. AN10 TaxID=3423365 RepID=UPI003D32008E
MLHHSSLNINPIREQELLRILPCIPRASSFQLHWKHLNIAYYHLPSVDCPEHTLSKHVISLNLGRSVRLERTIDHQVESDRFSEGDILCINPAGLYRTIRVSDPSQILHLYLEPEFVSHWKDAAASGWIQSIKATSCDRLYPRSSR